MNKLFTFLATVVFCVSAIAQQEPLANKNYQKAKNLYEAGKWTSADKFIEKCLSTEGMKDNPSVLLLKSKIQYSISKDGSIAYKFPSALKEALKYAEKAVESYKNESSKKVFLQINEGYFKELIRTNTEEAMDAFNLKKYSKALPLLKKSLYFRMDTLALVSVGDCYWEQNKRFEALPYYRQAAEMIYNGIADSNFKAKGYSKEPFRKLCEWYLFNKQLDSAYLIVKNGREIVPNDPVLNSYTYELMKNALEQIPPGYDYLKMVSSSLKDFPSDSFLNHRENAVYIFLLNSMAINNEQHTFDSLMNIYAKSKVAKQSLKDLNKIRQYDIFAGQNPDVFYKDLCVYFKNIGLSKAAYAAWISIFNQSNPNPDPKKLHANILNSLSTETDINLAEAIFNRHLELYPNQPDFKKGISDYTLSKNKSDVSFQQLNAMISLNDKCSKLFPANPEFKNRVKALRLKYLSISPDSGDFRGFRKVWAESDKAYPDQKKNLDELWKNMVRKDFVKNYFGSKINPKGKKETGIPEYAWNGFADSCKEGSMPDEVALRVEQRVNYFRRMAGLTEMSQITRQDNELCMLAVMMCESNKTMSHDPSDGWRCYVPAGADALKNSLLIRESNPAIAITAAMGHDHPTAGNRRWLLYPYSLYMGIGTSKTFSAIRVVDESRDLDTNKYKNQYIAWPPAGYCPKMFMFKKWSFSIDRNLKDAVVTMKNSEKQNIELKQESIANGYGLNTLVWTPQINPAEVTENSVFFITVKLGDGTTYNYTVSFLDIKP